jgi:hypothetical protein
MKVYIAVRLSGDSCSAEVETDVLGVFSTKEKARDCIKTKSEHLLGERFYRDIGDSISAVIDRGIEVDYRYNEYELNEVQNI